MKSDFQTILDRLKAHSAVTVHRSAQEDEIRLTLRTLKAKFPKSYLAFLRQCGWADLNGDTVYGLGPDASDAESVLEVTCVEHVTAKPPMRWFLIPFMNDGSGNHDCLDTSKTKDGECPVVFWDHEDPKRELQKPKKVAASFAAWLDEKLDDLPEM